MKLRTDSIKKSYKGRQVVQGVSVEVNQGEIVGLLGPNGAGKTTSFYMIVGLVRPNSGKVYLDDLDITRLAMYKRAQLGIGYLPQEVSVFRKMSIEDNIMTVLEMTDLNKTERHAKLESLLDEFGLKHVRKNLGQSLSGGEKRRTEIARALATDPKFILLDEPFAGVDPIAVEDIQAIVHKLKERNIGVLITDHNVQETLSITDRTYLMFEGSILREGTAESLAADEMVRKVYLGENFELRKKNSNSEGLAEEIRSEEERALSYVKNILNVAKQVHQKIDEEHRNSTNPDYCNDIGVTELIASVNNLKNLVRKTNPTEKIKSVLEKMTYGPVSKYDSPAKKLGHRMLAAIPGISWYYAYKMTKNISICKQDTGVMISQLETLKHLLEHPDLEKML